MKNFLASLNGWQRIFVVFILLIQTPITIFFLTSQNIEYIGTKEINTLANTLFEEKKISTKVRIFALNKADSTKFSTLPLADIDWSKDPKVENVIKFSSQVFEARKVGYTDSEILDYLVKEQKLDVSKAKRNGTNDTDILNNVIAQSYGGKKIEIRNTKFNYVYDLIAEENLADEQVNSLINTLKEKIANLYYLNFYQKIFEIILSSILVSIFIYFVGFSIGWVIKGFQKSKG
jgi:hypothetical protein